MKKYIMLIDSLVKTFSIVETSKDIEFNYQDEYIKALRLAEQLKQAQHSAERMAS